MVIAAGIDAGTKSYRLFAIKDGNEHFKKEIETEEVKENPEIIFKELKKSNADITAGLSGYGLPVKGFSELTDRDMYLMSLTREKEEAIALRTLIKSVINRKINMYTIPGIIHLPTVPEWRKINKIDMGTADKLCSVVSAMDRLSDGGNYCDQNFILVEAGYGFNAFISVSEGKIIDGIGGTSGFPSFLSSGSIDAEFAYLLSDFPKSMIFSGGIRSYLRAKGSVIDGLEELPDESIDWIIEFVVKSIRVAEVSIGKVSRIVTSGRFFGVSEFKKMFEEVAAEYDIVNLDGFQSARGAAIIADGLADGKFKPLVEHLEIMRAKGTVLDYITPDIRKYIDLNWQGEI
jgi:predicted butyrate kinase (DUF1464 family)